MDVVEISPSQLAAALARYVVVDIRDDAERVTGVVAGAAVIAADHAAAEISERWHGADVVVVCARGRRSAAVVAALDDLGVRAASLAGGMTAWRAAGLPVDIAGAPASRWRAQMALSEVGGAGQARIANGRVLVVGAGGLGCPAILHLAAAGVGTIGIADADVVALDNLPRQTLYCAGDIGNSKAQTAARVVAAQQPHTTLVPFAETVDATNAARILDVGWNLVINATDSFAARDLLNTFCVARGLPLIDGAIHRFEGEVTVVAPGYACCRCRFPSIGVGDDACATTGVLGVAPATIGTLQAAEALKLLAGYGTPLTGRVLSLDLLSMEVAVFDVLRDPACAVCGAGRGVATDQSASNSGESPQPAGSIARR